MANGKSDTPQVWEYQGGDWRHRVLRDMTPDELAKRDADFKAYEDMLARQEAYMTQRLGQIRQKEAPSIKCRASNITEGAMGLKIRLRWFDKISESLVDKEYSKDFGDVSKVMGDLNISLEDNINNGNLDVVPEWVEILQQYFKHPMDLSKYDYQVSFDYRNVW